MEKRPKGNWQQNNKRGCINLWLNFTTWIHKCNGVYTSYSRYHGNRILGSEKGRKHTKKIYFQSYKRRIFKANKLLKEIDGDVSVFSALVWKAYRKVYVLHINIYHLSAEYVIHANNSVCDLPHSKVTEERSRVSRFQFLVLGVSALGMCL